MTTLGTSMMGERYHHYTYLGEFEDDDMPTSDADLWNRK